MTNALSPKALVCARSLGKRNINVILGETITLAPSFFSKYCKERFLYPDPVKYPERFIDKILRVLKKNKVDMILPINSIETLLVSKYKSEIEKYTIVPLTNYQKMMMLHDKGFLAEKLSQLQIPHAKTIFINNLEELPEKAATFIYPCVIKLRQATSSKGIWYINRPDELIERYNTIVKKNSLFSEQYPIVQEYIYGRGAGVSMVYNRGKLIARFSHLRLREYPITGGPSTFRMSIHHKEMEKSAEKLINSVSWHGLVMVEFKLTNDNKPILIEVNPRVWGSINQAVVSGVDFPYLVWKISKNEKVSFNFNYNLKIKTCFILRDILALVKLFFNSKNKAVRTIPIGENVRYDVLSLRDPLPFFIYLFWRIFKGFVL